MKKYLIIMLAITMVVISFSCATQQAAEEPAKETVTVEKTNEAEVVAEPVEAKETKVVEETDETKVVAEPVKDEPVVKTIDINAIDLFGKWASTDDSGLMIYLSKRGTVILYNNGKVAAHDKFVVDFEKGALVLKKLGEIAVYASEDGSLDKGTLGNFTDDLAVFNTEFKKM